MEAETQADDDAQTTTETYTGFEILSHIEEGDTIRVPDEHYKGDFKVQDIHTNADTGPEDTHVFYAISNPHGAEATLWFDATAPAGERMGVGQSDYCLNKHNITLVKED